MKAVVWHGKDDVRVDRVPDPKILNPRDAIVGVSLSAICGSDLHLVDGYIPSMQSGDILGHEFMGEVLEVGPGVTNLQKGDRVVVPFTIACGQCFFCQRELFSACDNSNPNAHLAEAAYGYSSSGLFGYSHLTGGYAGGQAEYVRVPYADVGCFKLPRDIPDEKLLFLGDIFSTGYQAVEMAGIQGGDTVAVWGCGPVGQFTIRSAQMLGAARVIAVDRVPERLAMARGNGAEAIDFSAASVLEVLREMTGGRGPDVCVDAVGMEAHGMGVVGAYDRMKQAVRMETDRPYVLREAIMACRKGGTVSIPGVYGGIIDKVPIGAAFNKGLKLIMGQTHVHRYVPQLLARIERGEIDPSFVITHRIKIDEAPEAYKTFREKRDNCIKVVMRP